MRSRELQNALGISRQRLGRAGAGKLLFGSDGPWLHPALELQKIRLLGLSEPEQRLVLGGNFLRLIRRA